MMLLTRLPFARPVNIGVTLLTALVGGLLAVRLWGARFDHVFEGTGEHSLPLVLSLPLVSLAIGIVVVLRDRSQHRAASRGIAASFGMLAGAVLIAGGAAATGMDPGTSYYAAKMGEAAWLAALPVLIGLAAGVLMVPNGAGSHPARVLAGGVAMAVVIACLAVLPVGRAGLGLGGVATLAQRLLEAQRAEGQVRVTEAATAAGPASGGEASGMVEPSGWLYKVSFEDAPAGEWERQAVSASLWMATLRGIRTEATDAVAHCFRDAGDTRAIPCIDAWLAGDSGRSIAIGVGDTPSAPAFEAWADRLAERVRIIRLSP
jgi:hypothetical protein